MRDTSFPSTAPAPLELLKSWSMVIIALVFVVLYILGVTNVIVIPETVKNLQPLIFVVIGYYFGWLPSRQNTISLKEEISRQTQKADAAHYVKEKAQMEREMLEEKLRNVRVTLGSAVQGDATKTAGNDRCAQIIETGLKILDS